MLRYLHILYCIQGVINNNSQYTNKRLIFKMFFKLLIFILGCSVITIAGTYGKFENTSMYILIKGLETAIFSGTHHIVVLISSNSELRIIVCI
jgi:hypothetical protein